VLNASAGMGLHPRNGQDNQEGSHGLGRPNSGEAGGRDNLRARPRLTPVPSSTVGTVNQFVDWSLDPWRSLNRSPDSVKGVGYHQEFDSTTPVSATRTPVPVKSSACS